MSWKARIMCCTSYYALGVGLSFRAVEAQQNQMRDLSKQVEEMEAVQMAEMLRKV